MTRNADAERLMANWIDEQMTGHEPPGLLARVLDTTRGRRPRHPLLASLSGRHLSPRPGVVRHRKERPMIRMPLLIAGIATAAIVAAVGLNLIGTSGDSGSGAPGSTPPPTTSATATTATGDPIGRLLAGIHTSRLFTPRLQFEVPTGWATLDDQPSAYVLRGNVESRLSGVYCPESGPDWGESCRAPGDEEIIVVQRGPVLATDAAGCEGRAATGAPTSIDGMIGAIAADPRLATSQRETVAISGYVGEALYVKLNPSWTKTCKWSAGKPAAMILTVAQPPGPTFGVRAGERMRLMLLDVRGDLIAIVTKRTWRSSSDPVVETFQFGP